jgi:hypothetical protein
MIPEAYGLPGSAEGKGVISLLSYEREKINRCRRQVID